MSLEQPVIINEIKEQCCFSLKHKIWVNCLSDTNKSNSFDSFLFDLFFFSSFVARRSAFTAALFDNSNNLNCLGPFSNTIPIQYKKVFTNLGNNYNSNTGIYKAPFKGVYSLSVSVFHDAGQGTNEQSCVLLYVNGDMVAGSHDIHTFDHEDSTTVSITINLKAGDEVMVKLQAGCLLCMIKDHYNVFSGFLLYRGNNFTM
uniref:C1q domain-containing protein n=1 Tax=Periophthalmus magnuspinnatus TaxID=409849 RepID=A0A3B3ZIV1_9GOBI